MSKKKKKDSGVLAWHWLADDHMTQYDRPRMLVTPGLTLSLPNGEKPELCWRGYHASLDPLDALQYARGSVICRVRMDGEIVYGDDKLVASSRTVLWMADATYALHVFACNEASRALMAARERGAEIDPRSVNAIAVKMKWVHGEATDVELSTAWGPAWRAVSDAASAAANAANAAVDDAAYAAAYAAARASTYDAEYDAEYDAVDDAAYAAANDVAYAATYAAAYVAARDDQKKRFLSFMESLAPEETER